MSDNTGDHPQVCKAVGYSLLRDRLGRWLLMSYNEWKKTRQCPVYFKPLSVDIQNGIAWLYSKLNVHMHT